LRTYYLGYSHFLQVFTPESPMITLYGIPNCDTVKKARAWLADHGKSHEFHDFKKHGVPTAELARWANALGWEALLNRKGTTWRKLTAEEQAAVTDSASAQALMQAQSSVIKRPVVDWGGGDVTVGFDLKVWENRV
jgi:arsenate reductase (glutaredoxin)